MDQIWQRLKLGNWGRYSRRHQGRSGRNPGKAEPESLQLIEGDIKPRYCRRGVWARYGGWATTGKPKTRPAHQRLRGASVEELDVMEPAIGSHFPFLPVASQSLDGPTISFWPIWSAGDIPLGWILQRIPRRKKRKRRAYGPWGK